MYCELTFNKAGDFTGGISGYSTYKTFYFESGAGTYTDAPSGMFNSSQRGNCTVSRSVSKSLVSTTLPVDTFYEGGLAVDVGFTDDSFAISIETHNWDEYRYITGLVKSNSGLESGIFKIGPTSSTIDQFHVAVKNLTCSFKPGAGFYCKISLSLLVVNATS